MSHAILPPAAYFTLDHNFDGRKATIGTLHYPAAMLDAVLAEEVAFWQEFTSDGVLRVVEDSAGTTLVLTHGYIRITVVTHDFRAVPA